MSSASTKSSPTTTRASHSPAREHPFSRTPDSGTVRVMGEKQMIAAVQAALDHHGIEDTIEDVGQFEPRGTTGALFAGGMIGDSVGEVIGGGADAIGGAVGALAGIHSASDASGLPTHMLVGASPKAVYGF